MDLEWKRDQYKGKIVVIMNKMQLVIIKLATMNRIN